APKPIAKPAPAPTPKPVAKAEPAPALDIEHPQTPRKFGDKPLASPAVRQRANELGIRLQFGQGSGPGNRVTHGDLDAFIAKGPGASLLDSSQLVQREGEEQVKVIGLRRKIAEKMVESKRRIPHYAYVDEIDMTELEDLRVNLNETKRPDQPKLTLLPFIMRALVRVLPEFPQI